MIPPGSELDINIADFAARLLGASETGPRARIIAQVVLDRFPATTATIYILQEDDNGPFWSVKASLGEGAEPDPTVNADSGTLGAVFQDPRTVVFEASNLVREDYAHLNVRRTVKGLACVPLLQGETLVGAIEVLSFDEPLQRHQMEALAPLAEIAAASLVSSLAYEQERHGSLTSITRLTQFYDIEKVFSSTLEMDELLPIIGGKMREMLECEAVNVWLVREDGSILLMHRAGEDPTTEPNMVQKGGEGLAGDVSDTGESVLIDDPADVRLIRRNANAGDAAVRSIIIAPLMDKQSLVGVVESVNRLDGTPFDEDDLFVLTSLNESAALALHNASLLLAERKVEILQALVTVSQEITSTLDLERVMQAIVNGPQAAIPYEPAAIAVEQAGRLRLGAVSGRREIDSNDPQIKPLEELLRWAALSNDGIYIRQHGEEIDDPREETKAKFARYFDESGMHAFYGLPLIDESGRVGVLSFESSDPDFLSEAHLEMIKVLAAQATVALRNAQMYKEVPFISVLEPVLKRKRKFLAMEKRRRQAIIALVVTALLFLLLCPLLLRVDGDATVAPVHAAQVMPEIEGIVKAVYAREGSRVKAGQVLAELEPWNYEGELAAARSKYQTALSEMNRALATNDGTEAGIKQVQADYWGAELKRAQERLSKTQLRSPIEGVIATPHLENLVGRHLALGDTFAEVQDTSQATVDVAIDETDAPLLKAGQRAAIKLEGFPTRTFRGEVVVVSPRASVQADRLVFFARVTLPNNENAIRTGMQGRGKVSVGWHPAGYVFLRGPGQWLYSKLWSWFGW